MRKRAFLINSLMLTSAVLLSRVIGISFRVYMSNKIGAEGIGLYQLICTIFLFASTFVTSGVSLAVTRLVTEALARKEYQKAKTAVRRALVLGLFFSLLMGGRTVFQRRLYWQSGVEGSPHYFISEDSGSQSAVHGGVRLLSGIFLRGSPGDQNRQRAASGANRGNRYFRLGSELSGAHGPGICLLRHCAGNDRCGDFFLPVFFFALLGRAAEAQGQGF